MIVAEIIESSLLIEKSSYYELSILIGVDSFVFVVFDEQNRLLALKHWNFEKFSEYRIEHYEMAFRNEPILSLTFRKVNIGIRNRRYTLIPAKLYDENHKEKYLQNLVEFSSTDLIFADKIPDEKIFNIFAFPKKVFEFFKQKFPNASLYHSTTPVLYGFSRLAKNAPGDNMLVNFRSREIDIVVFKDGKVRLVNSYPVADARDNLYFILLIFEQFGLKQNTQPVFVSGMIDPNLTEFKQMKRYIPNLQVFEYFENVRTGNKFKNRTNKHHYFDIISFNSYIHDSNL